MMPSDEDLALLNEHAFELDGRWLFPGSQVRRSAEETLILIKACLALGCEVTDILPAKTWVTLVNKVLALETRLDEVELTGLTRKSAR